MPIAEVQLPDGRIAELEVSEGTSEKDILAFAEQNFGGQQAQEAPKASLTGIGAISIQDVAFGDKTFSEFAQNRLDAIKNLPGQVVEGLSQPWPKPSPETTKQLMQAGTEAATTLLPTTPMSAATRLAAKPALQAANPVQTATLQAAAAAGYSVPKTYLKQGPIGRAVANIGDRFAGKHGTEQVGQALNQPFTNVKGVLALSKTPQGQALGVTKTTQLSEELIDDVIKESHKAYEAVRGIGNVTTSKGYMDALDDIASKYTSAGKSFPGAAKNAVNELVNSLKVKTFDSSAAVDMVKILRENATKAFRQGEGGLGFANRKAADTIEKEIGEHLIRAKSPKDLAANYQSARRTLAIAGKVKDAFNPATGNLDAVALGQMSKKGVPLTGELKEIADFARAFKQVAKEPVGAPPSGGMLEPLAYAAFGKIADPTGAGLVAAGLPLIGKPIARKFMMTRPSTKPPGELLSRFGTQRSMLGLGVGFNRYNED